MAESTRPEGNTLAASFCAHLQAFHDGLPAEEQTLLEQVFLAAASTEHDQADVQGFVASPTPVMPVILNLALADAALASPASGTSIPRQQIATFVVR
jgi:hypothetical protein